MSQSAFDRLKQSAEKVNVLTVKEYTNRFKNRLIYKGNKTPDIVNEWVEEIGEESMFMFMLRFPNNPEDAADDDIMYAE
jgi:hypothetical protein